MAATPRVGPIDLADLRDAAAGALAPIEDTDPAVLVDTIDAVSPPALMILWGDPWLEPGVGGGRTTMGPCLWTARLVVLCVAGRVEAGAGLRALDELVAYTVDRLRADGYPWPLDRVDTPRQLEIAGPTYLTARVQYVVPTTI